MLLTVTIILSVLLLYSLIFCKRAIDTIQLFLITLFSSYLCQNIFYKVFSSYDRLNFTNQLVDKWTVKLFYAVILPSLLVWGLYLFKIEVPPAVKVFALFLWVSSITAAEKWFLAAGLLKSDSSSWYPSIDLFLGMVIICIVFMADGLIEKIMRKEKVRYEVNE
ncbi:hypothetical protein [Bacillus sp. AK031]